MEDNWFCVRFTLSGITRDKEIRDACIDQVVTMVYATTVLRLCSLLCLQFENENRNENTIKVETFFETRTQNGTQKILNTLDPKLPL